QDGAAGLIDDPIGGTPSQAMPWFGMSAVADNDQVELPGFSQLDDSPCSVAGDGPAVQAHVLLLSQLERLALHSGKVAVRELRLVLHFVDGGREAREMLFDRQSQELAAELAAQGEAPSEGAPGGFRPFESNQNLAEHGSRPPWATGPIQLTLSIAHTVDGPQQC